MFKMRTTFYSFALGGLAYLIYFSPSTLTRWHRGVKNIPPAGDTLSVIDFLAVRELVRLFPTPSLLHVPTFPGVQKKTDEPEGTSSPFSTHPALLSKQMGPFPINRY